MNYKDLKNVAEARNILIKDLAEQLGMTPNGFKVSIETEKFPIGKVRYLCEILQITIAEFFGEATNETPFIAAERVPYSKAPAVSKRETPDWKDEVILGQQRTIARLEAELDRKAGKKHKSA